jgi:hypothetical protein
MQRALLLERSYSCFTSSLFFRIHSETSSPPHWWPFPVTALICGFLLSLGLTSRRFWVPTCLLLTLLAAYAVLIVADSVIGAIDHNLFPIEFMFIALLTSPAYLGALLGAAIDRFRSRGLKT